jgi:hypothetical protein
MEYICFLVCGGALEFLVEEVRDREDTLIIEHPSERRTNSPGAVSNPVIPIGPPSDESDPLAAMAMAHLHLTEHSGASYRAITSLYAGTGPRAGYLNGKVRYPVSRLIALGTSTYWICNNISLYSISPHVHASHFRIRRHSTGTLG